MLAQTFNRDIAALFIVEIVSDADLANPEFLRDLRIFAANLRVPRGRMLDFLADGYRDSEAVLVDADGNPAEIDLDLLEQDGIEWWFKDWCKRPPANITPRLWIEARERVRVVATLLRLIFPKELVVWGGASIQRISRLRCNDAAR